MLINLKRDSRIRSLGVNGSFDRKIKSDLGVRLEWHQGSALSRGESTVGPPERKHQNVSRSARKRDVKEWYEQKLRRKL